MTSDTRQRQAIIGAYDDLIKELAEDRELYYINFMFDQLPGSLSAKKAIMVQQVERVHGLLSRHISRRPKSNAEAWLAPIFIGCHDLPVYKHDKEARAYQPTANDGLHFNALALVPPARLKSLPRPVEKAVLEKSVSRLRVPLHIHFEQKQRTYLTDQLYRIHVTPVRWGTMTDYTLKTFKNARVDGDSILILK